MGMTIDEAREFLIGISYKLGNMSVEYLSEKDGEKMRGAIKTLEQEPTTKIEESNFSQEQYLADIQSAYDCGRSVIDKIRAEIKEWYWQADKQALAKDPCVVDAMIDLFIRTIDKYKAETEVDDGNDD